MLNRYRENFLIFGIILISVICLKWNFLETPFFFEERPFTFANVHRVKLWNIFIGNYPTGYFAHHQTIMPVITYYLYRAFSFILRSWETYSIIHLIFACISSGTLFYLYKITRLIFNRGILFSLIPSIFLLFFPDFFIQSSNYRYDIFTAFIAMLFIYSRLSKKIILYLISGLLLSNCRETVLAFFVSTLLVDIFLHVKKIENVKKYILISLTHIAAYLSFYLIRFLQTGNLTNSEAANEINTSILGYLKILFFDIRWLFFDDGKWFLTIILIGYCVFLIKKKYPFKTEFLYITGPIALYCFGMAFHIFEASYYLFPVLPLTILIITIPIVRFSRMTNVFVIIILWLGNCYSVNIKNNNEFLSENGTEYKKIVTNYRMTIKYMSQFSQAKINAEWPLVHYLISPLLGYLDRGVDFKNVQSMTKGIWAEELGHSVISKLDCENSRFDYIIVSEQSSKIKIESQMNLIKKCNYLKFKEIKNDRFLTTVYKHESL